MRDEYSTGTLRSAISRRETLKLGAAAFAAAATFAVQAQPIQQDTNRNSAKPLGVAGDAIRPFHVSFPQSALDTMRRRIREALWPERETVMDSSQGVQLATMQ